MDKKTLYVRLDEKAENKFLQIKNFLGLENDTEVVRSLINWYWRDHENELLPKLEQFNMDENGVKILDRELGMITQIYFHPDKIFCEYCEVNNCKHVKKALSLPKVQEILQKKGWKYREG